jgi:hypothetical protein
MEGTEIINNETTKSNSTFLDINIIDVSNVRRRLEHGRAVLR